MSAAQLSAWPEGTANKFAAAAVGLKMAPDCVPHGSDSGSLAAFLQR
jgi:hypothetical protein